MVIIVTPASEINKAEKWKWWLWLAWCGICKATAKRIFISLFQVPAQYRQTDSAIRAHALMEVGWKDLTSRGRSVQPIFPASVECSICYTLHSGKKLTNNIYQCCIFSEQLDIYGAATRNVQITSNWRFLLPLFEKGWMPFNAAGVGGQNQWSGESNSYLPGLCQLLILKKNEWCKLKLPFYRNKHLSLEF